jgi:hypothetical protein
MEMMADEAIVEEGVSPYGLHQLHVMRMGREVDLERWVEEKVEGGVVVLAFRYVDEIGIHHLRLYWRGTEELPRRFTRWDEGSVVPHANGNGGVG